MSTCRSCGAPIRWTMTEQGRRMPLDLEPTRRIVLVGGADGTGETAVVRETFSSHFETCPDAAAHRRPRTA